MEEKVICRQVGYLRDMQAGCNEIIKHFKLQNVSRGEMSKKKKVKIRTQNDKIIETGMEVCY